MMGFEEWMLKKQDMDREWFLTMIDDKKPYYEAYDKYRCRAALFDAEVIKKECEQVAKELVALAD